MSSGNTTVPSERPPEGSTPPPEIRLVGALTIACAVSEPSRMGEVAVLDGAAFVGRGDGDVLQVIWERQGPGERVRTGSLNDVRVSRRNLDMHYEDGSIYVEHVRGPALRVNGRLCTRAKLEDSDVVEIVGHYVFLFTLRPACIPACVHWPFDRRAFGEPDPLDIMGDSPGMWAFRELLAKAALTDYNVLFLGETGVGKDLAARGIHRMSRRAAKAFVNCNASAMEPGVIDGELSGNRKDFPQGGMPESPGLFGAADGGTLFLDEIGDMSAALQHRLLQALEGTYRRLGEQQTRTCDFRCIGATNRDVDSLEGDVFGRFRLKIDVPNLDDRREDIPLLVRHLVLAAAKKNPRVAGPFVRTFKDQPPQIAIDAAFMVAIMRHHYVRNVRELDGILAQSFLHSEGEVLMTPKGVFEQKPVEKKTVTRDEILAAMKQHEGNETRAAKMLGISRWVLHSRLKER